MVKALHAAGIEVILDVVFNHTAKATSSGPTLSFKGLENRVYYMLGNGGSYYMNYSGCGNTVNGNHPVVREMIFHCLRHWVHNYHVDGFRFDLASILSRDRNGELVPNPPLVELIAEDPLLADTKIIAEAWDAAGAYQVGSFGDLRWAEWNGRYRDDVRRFWRGDDGHDRARWPRGSPVPATSTSTSGRRPYHSINFITSHDGFTLNDLVSYKRQAQRGQRRRQPRRRQQQLQRQLRRRRPDAAARASTSLRVAADQELAGHAAAQPGRADDRRRRRMPPHAEAATTTPTARTTTSRWFDWTWSRRTNRSAPLRAGPDRVPPPQPTVRREHVPHRQAEFEGDLPDVSWFSALGTAVDWHGDDATLICLLKAVEPRARSRRQSPRRADPG